MKTIASSPIIFIFLIGCFVYTSLRAQDHVPGQVIVQLKYGKSVEPLLKYIKNDFGSESQPAVDRVISQRLNIWLIGFDEQWISDHQFLDKVRGHADVKVAQFNHYVEQRSIPDDPEYPQQWGFDNTGQSGGSPGADISAPEAWDITTGGLTALGDTIVVAVIDGGFDMNHDDLDYFINRFEIPGDGIDNDNNGYKDDYSGWDAYSNDGIVPNDDHGTHVAGTVAAKGDNNLGVTGVNWNTKILPIAGSSTQEAIVMVAYGYALEMRATYNATNGERGAFIVATNSSFGVNFGDPVDYPIWCGLYDSMGYYGILSAGATMNNGSNVDVTNDIPTACPSDWLITVTNTTHDDVRNGGAAYGITTIDLGAPGTGILSTTIGNNYGNKTGTSMATPHVAGAIALLYSGACEQLISDYKDDPAAVALIIKDFLFRGVDTIPALQSELVTGGRLNLFKSLQWIDNYNGCGCMTVEVDKNDISCKGETDGEINLNIPDGASPFVFDWSTGDSTPAIDSLGPGTYIVRITDSLACKKTSIIEISEPDEIALAHSAVNATPGKSDGEATVLIFGGTAPYTFEWDDPKQQSGQTATGLAKGSYSVIVTDANGCSATRELTISDATGIARLHNAYEVTVYPNPADRRMIVQIDINNPGVLQDLQIAVIDMLGRRLVVKPNVALHTGKNTIEIPTSQYSEGIYFLEIHGNGHQLGINKILVQHE